jgi:transcriptional regulator with XRE-family HTH domain
MAEGLMVRTKVFELSYQGYRNLSELAEAMGISVSQIYRVREGKRRINQKFIVGAAKAFPGYGLDELFYLATDETAGGVSSSR